MKAGTSQKLLCDMISTTIMCRLGRVEGNRMVQANLINNKVIDRLTRTMVERNPQLSYEFCQETIKKTGGLIKAEKYLRENNML
jgi:N-acetylmuramic acid 6-phosphate etherase